MTDFSPLDSALHESTPEQIAAALRYLRKADAVMAALMPLSASTQAPPTAVPAGYVLVPVEPTEKMLEVGESALYAFTASAVYGAMIYAAQTAANKENTNG